MTPDSHPPVDATGSPDQVAYLVNQYPSPSHSFIRREILALEAVGWKVHRFAHRINKTAVVDPSDLAELGRTTVLLADSLASMLHAVLSCLVRDPARTASTALLSMRMAWTGDRRFVAHAAYFMMACVLTQRLQALRCRHLHAHFGTNPAAVACLANRLSGLTYSATFHGPHEFDRRLRLNLRDKIAAAAFVATVSCTGLRKMVEQFPAYATKFKLIRCGLDASWFSVPEREATRNHNLLCVARLEPQKNPALLLSAAKLLVQRGTSFRLTIAGDGELREELLARIESDGLVGHVVMVGWQTQQQVFDHLSATTALVSSSHDEGLPVAITEAFAVGVPVIAPDVGGVHELVETGVTGWLVPEGDATALADAIQQCLGAQPETIRRMGSEARKRAGLYDIRNSVRLVGEEFMLAMRNRSTPSRPFD